MPEVKGKKYHDDARTVLAMLNELSQRAFRETDSNLTFISERLKEVGVTLDGVRVMMVRQCKRWLGTPSAEYLRPETLFNKTKFDAYYANREFPIAPVGSDRANPRNFGIVGETKYGQPGSMPRLQREREEKARLATQMAGAGIEPSPVSEGGQPSL